MNSHMRNIEPELRPGRVLAKSGLLKYVVAYVTKPSRCHECKRSMKYKEVSVQGKRGSRVVARYCKPCGMAAVSGVS